MCEHEMNINRKEVVQLLNRAYLKDFFWGKHLKKPSEEGGRL